MTLNISDKLMFLSAGVGIGAVIGLLFAPSSGQQVRNTIASKVQDSGVGEAASQKVQEVVERGKNIAIIGRQRLNESIEAGRQKFAESIEDEDIAFR